MVFSIIRPQTPTRALPLDGGPRSGPAGGLIPSPPVLSPPKQISGYALALYNASLKTRGLTKKWGPKDAKFRLILRLCS